MAYDSESLFHDLSAHLLDNPGVSLRQVAVSFEVDRHTIEKIVREKTGLSFRDYRGYTRLHAAKLLLAAAKSASVKQIAASLGYTPRAFSKFFLRSTGTTPSGYRRVECELTIINKTRHK